MSPSNRLQFCKCLVEVFGASVILGMHADTWVVLVGVYVAEVMLAIACDDVMLMCLECVYRPGDICDDICVCYTRRRPPRCQQSVPCYNR